jgi:hypothetical protein
LGAPLHVPAHVTIYLGDETDKRRKSASFLALFGSTLGRKKLWASDSSRKLDHFRTF